MTPANKPRDAEVDEPSKLPDPRSEWSDEDRQIEGRKPDLGEVEDDTSDL